MYEIGKLTSISSIAKKMSKRALYILEDHKNLRSDVILMLCQYITALGAIESSIWHIKDNYGDREMCMVLYMMTKESIGHATIIERDLTECGIILQEQ